MKLALLIKNYFPEVDTENFTEIKLSQTSSYDSGIENVAELTDLNTVISWPPNTFLILYALLDFTDKYRLIVSPQDGTWLASDRQEGESLKSEWANLLEAQREQKNSSDTIALKKVLGIVFNNNLNTCIYELCQSHELLKAIFKLIISIDELFSENEIDSNFNFYLKARKVIYNNINNLANNDGKTGVITYKYLVPQSGLTINNLCHNITYLKPNVKPYITVNKVKRKRFEKSSYNILFLPWPVDIEAESFTVSVNKSSIETNTYFDFFDYQPKKEISETDFILTVISAIERIGFIDIIVLPECSVSSEKLEKLKSLLFDCFGNRSPALLAGVYGTDGIHSKNIASLSFIGESEKFDTIEQNKHHRWFLDGSQLTNYNLANALDPGKKWWENIKIDRRKLVSLQTGDGIRVCPLICEDLARQEPVAQAVRALAPNLVISLLLDGPQIEQRWPGKYASVLSEDPGSSVLSVTALGMTLRSTGSGFPASRQVALWSEAGKKPETLILAEEGAGIVIALKTHEEKMWTIDGREKYKKILRKENSSTVPMKEKLAQLDLDNLKNILKGMVSKNGY